MRLFVLCLALAACPPPRASLPDVAPSADAEAALVAAEAAWSKRPDPSHVREALRLFQSASAKVEGLTGTIRTAAWLVEHGPKDDRKALVEHALAAAEQCQARAPATPACDYWQAAALGVAAREKPLSALGNLKELISLLQRAETNAPALDSAGPSRLLAIVLVRAPGWPAGPGNPDDGLVAAQKAVSLAPTYPPNQLALAEALAATGDTEGARTAYTKATELAKASADPDAADWLAQAAAGAEKL